MKKILCVALVFLFLCGCGDRENLLDRAMKLRADTLASAVTFDAEITADYGEKSYTFAMSCRSETDGSLSFTVTAPETLSGITGTVGTDGGKLTFNGTALAFELMADGQLSPVSGPWILMKSLRGGYLTSCNLEDGALRVAVDDSYEEDALHLDIWLDGGDLPKYAEIYWQGRRLLTVQITNFAFV